MSEIEDLYKQLESIGGVTPEIEAAMADLRGGSTWDDIVGGASAAFQGITFGWGDEARAAIRSLVTDNSYEEELAGSRKIVDDFRKENPKTALALEVGGGALTGGVGAGRALASTAIRNAPKLIKAAAPAALGAGEGAVAGAGYGNGNRLQGAATGAALGGVIGAAAPKVTGAVARMIQPKTKYNAAANMLKEADIPMTPGQQLGGMVRSVEDRATSIPLLGDVVAGAQRRGIEGFNRATINNVLAEVGEELSRDTPMGREAVDEMFRKVSSAYETLLPKMTLTLDDEMKLGLTRLVDNAQEGFVAEKNVNALKTFIQNNFAKKVGADGKMTGETMKAVESDLTKKIIAFKKSTDSEGAHLLDAFREMRSIFREGIARSNPEYAGTLKSINKAYAMRKIVGKAASKTATTANDGLFTPAHLNAEVAKAAGQDSFAAGRGMMQEFSDAAAQTLPRKIPDSGTAARAAQGVLAGGGLGVIEPISGTLAAMTAGMYTRPGQALFTKMLNRPGFAPKAAGATRSLTAPSIGGGTVAINR